MQNISQLYAHFEVNGVSIVPLRIAGHSENHPYKESNWMVRHAKYAGGWKYSNHYTLMSGNPLVSERDVLQYLSEQIEVTKRCIALASISVEEIAMYLADLNGTTKVINAPEANSPDMLEITEDGIESKIKYLKMGSPKYSPSFWEPILAALEKSYKIMANYFKV